MQVTMEMLTKMIPQIDIGAGVRQRQFSGERDGSRFADVMDGARANGKTDNTKKTDGKLAGLMANRPMRMKKSEPDAENSDNADNADIAGLAAEQNNVVVILQGDKDTNSEINVDGVSAVVEAEAGAAVTGLAAGIHNEAASENAEAVVAKEAADVSGLVKTDTTDVADETANMAVGQGETVPTTDESNKVAAKEKAVDQESAVEQEQPSESKQPAGANVESKKQTNDALNQTTDADSEKQTDTGSKQPMDVGTEHKEEPRADAAQGTQAQQNADAKQSTDVQRNADAKQGTDVQQNADAKQGTDVQQNADAKQSGDVQHNPDVRQKAAENTNVRESDPKLYNDVTASQDEMVAADIAAAAESAVASAAVVEKPETSAAKENRNAPDTESGAKADSGNMIEEKMARMPEMRTSEQSDAGTGEKDAEFSENGDLCPLENENDDGGEGNVKAYKDSVAAQTEKDTKTVAKDDGAKTVKDTQTHQAVDIKPERFEAEQQVRHSAPNAAVKTNELFDTMVSRIEMMKSADTNQMTIQLRPEFLGKVSLQISTSAAGLHVKISAEDQSVRSMIGNEIKTLVETLSNKGIEVAKVEVAYTGVNNGDLANQNSGQQTEQPRRSGRMRVAGRADDMTGFAAAAFDESGHYIDSGISSVEYRA